MYCPRENGERMETVVSVLDAERLPDNLEIAVARVNQIANGNQCSSNRVDSTYSASLRFSRR
jgi:G3E family GTPase